MILEKIENIKNKIIDNRESCFKSYKTEYLSSLYDTLISKEKKENSSALFDEKEILHYINLNPLDQFKDSVIDVKKELLDLFDNIYAARAAYMDFADIAKKELNYIQYPVFRENGVPYSKIETIIEKIFKKSKLKKEILTYRENSSFRTSLDSHDKFLKSYFDVNNNCRNISFIRTISNDVDNSLEQLFKESFNTSIKHVFTREWNSYSVPTYTKVGVIGYLTQISCLVNVEDNANAKVLFNDTFFDINYIKEKSFQLAFDAIVNSIPLHYIHSPLPESKEALVDFNLFLFPSKKDDEFLKEFQEFFKNKYNEDEVLAQKIKESETSRKIKIF